jgi:Holliday junction resolvase RusA-like endonuclease
MRISIKDAKLLGIVVNDDKAGKKGRGPDEKTRKPSTSRGKNRLAAHDYGKAAIRFDIDLPDDPQPKERPRTVINMKVIFDAFVQARGNLSRFKELIKGRTSHTYTPKNTAEYEAMITQTAMSAMAQARLKPFECPVKTHIHLVFKGDPDTWPTSPGDGDADNLEKAVLDALNKVVYADDRLVVRSIRTKSCGPKARLSVKVAAMSRRDARMSERRATI